jgi:hypothetical protein
MKLIYILGQAKQYMLSIQKVKIKVKLKLVISFFILLKYIEYINFKTKLFY